MHSSRNKLKIKFKIGCVTINKKVWETIDLPQYLQNFVGDGAHDVPLFEKQQSPLPVTPRVSRRIKRSIAILSVSRRIKRSEIVPFSRFSATAPPNGGAFCLTNIYICGYALMFRLRLTASLNMTRNASDSKSLLLL